MKLDSFIPSAFAPELPHFIWGHSLLQPLAVASLVSLSPQAHLPRVEAQMEGHSAAHPVSPSSPAALMRCRCVVLGPLRGGALCGGRAPPFAFLLVLFSCIYLFGGKRGCMRLGGWTERERGGSQAGSTPSLVSDMQVCLMSPGS